MRKTIKDIQEAKLSRKPLVCLTAYTAPMAALLDQHCDILLVGDSVSMVLYGHPSTLQADMEMMIRHGQAVVRSSQNAFVIVDMPFGSYQESKEVAFRNAATILRETGAGAVKLEGGAELAETVTYLAERGIPVMGHVGLQPQSVHALGGYKAQGRDSDSAAKIKTDAQAINHAGAFAMVIEGVAESVAATITKEVSCPTIGIGASAACDGQILVSEDMLGMTQGKKPKFVKEYAQVAGHIEAAIMMYAQDVRARKFPDAAYTYGTPSGVPINTAEKATAPMAPVTPAPSIPMTPPPAPAAELSFAEPEKAKEEAAASPYSSPVLRAIRRPIEK